MFERGSEHTLTFGAIERAGLDISCSAPYLCKLQIPCTLLGRATIETECFFFVYIVACSGETNPSLALKQQSSPAFATVVHREWRGGLFIG